MTAAITIPPHGGHDPEGMNARRSGWGGDMIDNLQQNTGADEVDALADGLCDLMHWAHDAGFDFDKELRRACYHFEVETSQNGEL